MVKRSVSKTSESSSSSATTAKITTTTMDGRGYAAAYKHFESLAQGFGDPSSTLMQQHHRNGTTKQQSSALNYLDYSQPQQQQQQQQTTAGNHPCLANYNPATGPMNTYNPTMHSGTSLAAQHQLLMAAAGYGNHHLHQQQQHHQSQQQLQLNSSSSNSNGANNCSNNSAAAQAAANSRAMATLLSNMQHQQSAFTANYNNGYRTTQPSISPFATSVNGNNGANSMLNSTNNNSIGNNLNGNNNSNNNLSLSNNSNSSANNNPLGLNFDPYPLNRTVNCDSSVPAPGHSRTSSFDDFLMMNSGILSTATIDPFGIPLNAATSSSLNTASSIQPLASSPTPTASSTTAVAAPAAVSVEASATVEVAWLEEFHMEVSGLCLDTMSGTEIVARLRNCMNDVVTKYLPCVDFLVQCQQDLRKGLTFATVNKRSRRYGGMTPRTFFMTYVQPLPQRFQTKNQFHMESKALNEAMTGLLKLATDAKDAEKLGCESVKNHFLGGMKDGESWGLRKWLSKHGNALPVCTDCECIMQAIRKLDKSTPTTKKLADIVRPLAKQTLDRLKNDVPQSYQEHSSAHPYLPFFHRLESALRAMSQFNPEEDDVICIDDSDDDDVVVAAPAPPVQPPQEPPSLPPPTRKKLQQAAASETAPAPPPRTLAESKKRKAAETVVAVESPEAKRPAVRRKLEDPPGTAPAPVAFQPPPSIKNNDVINKDKRASELGGGTSCCLDDSSSSGESDDDSVIEVVGVKPALVDAASIATADDSTTWLCAFCMCRSPYEANNCVQCGEANYLKDFPADNSLANPDTINDLFGGSMTTDPDDLSDQQQQQSPPGSQPKKTPSSSQKQKKKQQVIPAQRQSWPVMGNDGVMASAFAMATKLDQLAGLFDTNQQASVRPGVAPHGSFWDGKRYGSALKLFSALLRKPEAAHYIERVDEDQLIQAGNPPFSHVIKHPICFRDIICSLLRNAEKGEAIPTSQDGRLPVRGLSSWNMWKGMDLLQAIDLVFLNTLAYGKAVESARSNHRAVTNKMRKAFWDGISGIVSDNVGHDADLKRQCTPTRRSESSGFVVYKIQER